MGAPRCTAGGEREGAGRWSDAAAKKKHGAEIILWEGSDGPRNAFMTTSLSALSVNRLRGSSLHLLHWLRRKTQKRHIRRVHVHRDITQ